MKDIDLIKIAKSASKYAYPWKSGTRVGCAIESSNGSIQEGWNVEGLWMTSIHAEVCAITRLAGYGLRGKKIAIWADASFFTPCGACLDWLFQFCDANTPIIIQGRDSILYRFTLEEICPHYSRQ